MKKIIQLHNPQFDKNEIKYINNCIKSGWVTTKGKYVEDLKKRLKSLTGAKFVLPVINGTSALHISLILSKVRKGDEVMVPTITYIASVNAIKYVGANPIFMDTEEDLNISLEKVNKFFAEETYLKKGYTHNKRTNKRISAIIVVHTMGNAADIKPLIKTCKKRRIKVIEDAAESLGTVYSKKYFRNKHTGTIGDYGCLSFNGNKIITSAGGGAILINTKKKYLLGNYLCDQAKDDSIYSIHNNIGYNYKLSNIQSALGYAQLKKLKNFLKNKKKIHSNYCRLFENNKNFSMLKPHNFYKSNFWLNVLIIKNNKKKLKKIISNLRKSNIEARPIWKANHLQKPYRKYQKYKIEKAEKITNSYICLPSSPNLTFQEQKKIYKIINMKK